MSPASSGDRAECSPDSSPIALLIDDSDEQRDLIQRHLRPHGIRVEWRTGYRSALELLRDPGLGPLVDVVLIDQAFDTEAVADADLLTAADIEAGGATEGWDVRLHQGLFILARLGEDIRAGRIPSTRLILLTSHASPPIPVQVEGFAGHLSKRALIADPRRALERQVTRLRAGAASPATPRDGVLFVLGPGLAMPWDGAILDAADAGPQCTDGPLSLTIWAPGGSWPTAFALLAMCMSARPEESLVLTDEPVPLDLVPWDCRVARVLGRTPAEIRVGAAAFACRNLRDDEVFRSLLTGRRRSELQPLLRLHALTRTRHGRDVLERWSAVLPAAFTGPPPALPAGLRADLEDLANAADRAQRACAGGFHGLDRVVRGATAWEGAARTYLRLAASGSTSASAAVERWLATTAGWHLAAEPRREALRTAAAIALHRLVDDPWLADEPSRRLFAPPGAGP
ncbi:MAG TPA: hypothetical protein VE953_15440 [Terriglobales bacterium]|nr:hypothetical protein [Terriglobales bacterium]